MGHINQEANLTLMGDRLRISVYSQVDTATLVIGYRMMNQQGDIVPDEQTINIVATGAQTIRRPIAGAHWIMSMVAQVTAGTVNPGDILVKVELVQGDVATQAAYQVLLFGSPDSFAPLTMGSPGETSVDGRRARQRTIAYAGPFANTSVNVPVDTAVLWRLVAATVTFVTQAAIGALTAALQIEDANSNLIYIIESPTPLGAGVTWSYSFAQTGNLSRSVAGLDEVLPIPDLLLEPNASLTFFADAVTGTYTIQDIVIIVLETILGY